MGFCLSAPTQLFETSASARTVSIGGLLAEGQTPAALGETLRRRDAKEISGSLDPSEL
jgi:hypothetical protein